MRLFLVSSLLLSCGAPARPPTITNQSSRAESPAAPCGPGLHATVIEAQGEPAIGATVVASRRAASPREESEHIVITDANGRFALVGVDADDTLTLFYNDAMYEGALPRGCEVVIEIGGPPAIRGDVQPFVTRRRVR